MRPSRRKRRPSGGSVTTLAADTFTRANGVLGTADTGGAWTVGGFTIASNQAANAGALNNTAAYLSLATADCATSVQLATKAGEMGVYVRYTDGNNWIRVVESGGTLYLQKMVAAALTTVATIVQAVSAGDYVGVRASGTTVSILYGTSAASLTALTSGTIAEFTAVTNHGLGCAAGDATARWDNFLVTT